MPKGPSMMEEEEFEQIANKGQYGLKPKFKAKGAYVDSNK